MSEDRSESPVVPEEPFDKETTFAKGVDKFVDRGKIT